MKKIIVNAGDDDRDDSAISSRERERKNGEKPVTLAVVIGVPASFTRSLFNYRSVQHSTFVRARSCNGFALLGKRSNLLRQRALLDEINLVILVVSAPLMNRKQQTHFSTKRDSDFRCCPPVSPANSFYATNNVA